MIEFDKDKLATAIEFKAQEATVREIADAVGVAAGTISRAMNGKTIDMDTFTKIVSWLGMKPEKFFKTVK